MIDHSALKGLDVLIDIDLPALAVSPSSSLYQQLIPFKKYQYQPQERIIFHAFHPVELSVLEHVGNLISYLDISPFFLIFFTDQSNVIDWCDQRPETYRVIKHHQVVPLPSETSRPLFPNDIMCAYAWKGLHVNVDGTVKVCCDFSENILDADNEPYTLKKHTPDQILGSDYMISIRDQFRQGITPDQCSRCSRYEKANSPSKRTLSRYKLDNVWGFIDWENDSIENTPLAVGAKTGNLCNLKCRSCDARSSSRIAAEELKHGSSSQKEKIKKIIVENDWAKGKSQTFWELLKNDNRFTNFEFMGGETLLLEENLEFMQYLLDSGRSRDCIFEIVTNATLYPTMFDRSDQFRRLTVTLSIDDLGKRFEYQRSGADWATVANNVNRWIQNKNANRNLEINVCVTVNIQNVLYLPELLEWFQQQGINTYFLNFLDKPAELSIRHSLTQAAKEIILEKYAKIDLDQPGRDSLQYVINTLKLAAVTDGNAFNDFTRNKDIIRQENYADAHNEMALAMGYKKHV